MAVFRTPADVRSNINKFIGDRLSGIRTDAGEPIADLVDATSVEIGKTFVVAEYLRRINSIAGWQSIIDDTDFKGELADALGISSEFLSSAIVRELGIPADLPNDVEALMYLDLTEYANSLGKPRKQATFATTTLRVFLGSGAPFTLLRGAVVLVAGSSAIPFATLDDAVGMLPGFDPAENAYFVDLGARSQVSGLSGNQVINVITVMSPPIQGGLRVTNQIPAEGGFPREGNQELLDRLVNAMTGRDIDTLNGLTTFVLSKPEVFDLAIIGSGDPLMQRASAGAVDVYLIGSRLVTVTTETKILEEEEIYVFQYQPLRVFNSGRRVGGIETYVPSAGLQLQLDEGLYAGSARALDALVWDKPPALGSGPAVGDSVKVNFTYNALLRDIQLELDNDPERNVPSTSYLVKEAAKIDVVATMKVIILPGNDQAVVEAAVLSALQGYFSLLKLGELVEFSTVVATAADTEIDGIKVVDRIDDLRISKLGDPGGVDNLPIGRNEYGRLFDVTF